MERIERSGAIFPTESARKRGKGRRSRRAPALSNLHTHEVVRTQKLSLVRWARGTFGVGARFWCICTEYSSHFLRILRKYLFTNSFSPCYNHHNIQIEARASSVPDGIRSGSGRAGKGRPPKRRGVPDCSLLGRLRTSAGLSQRQSLRSAMLERGSGGSIDSPYGRHFRGALARALRFFAASPPVSVIVERQVSKADGAPPAEKINRKNQNKEKEW